MTAWDELICLICKAQLGREEDMTQPGLWISHSTLFLVHMVASIATLTLGFSVYSWEK